MSDPSAPSRLVRAIQRASDVPEKPQRLASLLELAPTVASEAPEHADQLAEPLHRLGLELHHREAQATALWLRGSQHMAAFRFEEARTVLDAALEAARSIPEEQLTLRCLMALSEALFRRNLYNEALMHAREGIGLAKTIGDRPGEGVMRTWAGACQVQMSMYQEALEELHHARELLEGAEDRTRIAQALNYIAVVHEELGDYDEALTHYRRALDLLHGAERPGMRGKVLANYGEAVLNMGDSERALPILEEALETLEQAGDRSLIGWCLLAIARVHMDEDRDQLAKDYYERSLAEVQQGGAMRTRAEVLAGMGELYAKQGRRDDALEALREGLDLAREAHVIREIYKIHEVLAGVHEQFGDYEQALQHYKAFSAVRGAVWDEVAKAKVSALAARAELQRARHEREIERLRSVELKGAYDQLRELNEQLEDQAQELAELSIRDSLTGVFNRRHLDAQLDLEFVRFDRYGHPLSVALADLDNFKGINDRHSHAVGDEVLRRFTEIVVPLIRRNDLIARYGGEEFAIIFPDSCIESATGACDKIRRAVAAHDWSQIHPELAVTVSIGVSSAAEVEDWEKLIARADTRLYQAKRAGKDRVVAGD